MYAPTSRERRDALNRLAAFVRTMGRLRETRQGKTRITLAAAESGANHAMLADTKVQT
jgi:hypothetical protein